MIQGIAKVQRIVVGAFASIPAIVAADSPNRGQDNVSVDRISAES